MRTLRAAIVAFLLAVPVAAQNARDGRLIITVADQTTAVLPGATVTLTLQDVPNAPAIPPATTSTQGVVTFQALAQGRYTVRAEFDGFEVSTVRDVRVRAGENKQNVTLRIANLQDSITVGRDAATAASDRGPTFGTVLTREQSDALSEDPEEAQRQLQELAGPAAVQRGDCFEGSEPTPTR